MYVTLEYLRRKAPQEYRKHVDSHLWMTSFWTDPDLVEEATIDLNKWNNSKGLRIVPRKVQPTNRVPVGIACH